MFLINLFRLLNVILAVLSVIPALLMLGTLAKERAFLKNGSKKVNDILMLFYLAVVVGATYNAGLSMALVLNLFEAGGFTQAIFNTRNLVISSSYLVISWGLYFLRIHDK